MRDGELILYCNCFLQFSFSVLLSSSRFYRFLFLLFPALIALFRFLPFSSFSSLPLSSYQMGLVEAMEVVRTLAPETVYFVGMSCGIGLHEEAEAHLMKKYADILAVTKAHFAFDGQRIDGFEL
jgi:hypothetical protein